MSTPASPAVTNTVTVGTDPFGVAFDPVRRVLYIADTENQVIRQVRM